ncbi:hypothetical protein E2320_007917 [Naja naja]|nr:hypothetical protein E2320_007917 [Naja naja]
MPLSPSTQALFINVPFVVPQNEARSLQGGRVSQKNHCPLPAWLCLSLREDGWMDGKRQIGCPGQERLETGKERGEEGGRERTNDGRESSNEVLLCFTAYNPLLFSMSKH